MIQWKILSFFLAWLTEVCIAIVLFGQGAKLTHSDELRGSHVGCDRSQQDCQVDGVYLEDHPMTRKCLITMVIVSPLGRLIPFPNGLFMVYNWGDPNYLRYLG